MKSNHLVWVYSKVTMLFSFLCVVFMANVCNTALLHPSRRCAISDGECQKNFFQYVGSNYSKKGIPEIGIPILDPFVLQNITVTFKDLIKVTLLAGDATGIGDCIITRHETDIKTKIKKSDFICSNITIQGHYILTTGPFLRQTFGNLFNSEGNIVVTFENWNINATYPFEVEKHKDGEIYIRCLFDEAEYDQSFDNIKIQEVNITSGNELTSKYVVSFTNDNWKYLINSFGRYFGDKALSFYYNVHEKIFNNIPAKYYIKDDLSPYVETDESDNEDDVDDDD